MLHPSMARLVTVEKLCIILPTWCESRQYGGFETFGSGSNNTGGGLSVAGAKGPRRTKLGWRPCSRAGCLAHRLYIPYPEVRFDAKYPRYEPYAVVPLVRICAGLCQERVPRSAMLYQR